MVAFPSTIDIEALRILLVLPLYHEFEDGKHFGKLHSPYGRSLTRLKNKSYESVAHWLSTTSVEYFERLIIIFKEAVCFLMNNELKKSRAAPLQRKRIQIVIDRHFRNLLEALKMLFQINRLLRNETIEQKIFYLHRLNDTVHILDDFADYCMNRNEHKVFLFNFPFLYDARAKKTILQADQTFSMYNAVYREAVHPIQPNPYIQFTVGRKTIVDDAINEIERHVDNDLKKELRVKFVDEPADDLG